MGLTIRKQEVAYNQLMKSSSNQGQDEDETDEPLRNLVIHGSYKSVERIYSKPGKTLRTITTAIT